MKTLGYKLADLYRGTDTLALLDELRVRQYHDHETIQRATLVERDAYFTELKQSTHAFDSIACFEQLPVLTKSYIASNVQGLVNHNYQGKIFRKTTGGSTAEPLAYITGSQSQSYLWAGILLSWEAAGYKLGEPVALLAGTSLFTSGWKQTIFHRLRNITLFSAYELSPNQLDHYLEKLDSGGFRLLYGYPSAIHRLAKHLLLKGNPRFRHKLRAIIYTAEVLTSAMREDVEAAFDVPCFGQYGCNEAGVSAFECDSHNGYHLISTRCYHEVVGEGRLIATDLSNRAMFLPRIDTGDLVTMAEQSCSCGRGFPLIKEVLGRSNDDIVDPLGNVLPSLFFIRLFKEDRMVRGFQIVYDQNSLLINVHMDPLQIDKHKSLRQRYLTRVQSSLIFPETLFEYNLPFHHTRNGKRQFVIRR